MVRPVNILQPFPKTLPFSQKNVVVLTGQLPSYSAREAEVPVDPVIVLVMFSILMITDEEVAVKVYHTSSLFSVELQEGFGVDCVAPVVLTVTGLLQLVPKGLIPSRMAPVHSSLAGAAGTV